MRHIGKCDNWLAKAIGVLMIIQQCSNILQSIIPTSIEP